MENGQQTLANSWRRVQRYWYKHPDRVVRVSPLVFAVLTGLAVYAAGVFGANLGVNAATWVAFCGASVVFSLGLVFSLYLQRILLIADFVEDFPRVSEGVDGAMGCGINGGMDDGMSGGMSANDKIVDENVSLDDWAGTTVLLVEGNPVYQQAMRALLESLSVEVCVAVNGQEGADEFVGFQPDLVLMDLSLPEADGLQSTQIIRDFEQEQGAVRCPIIAITANALPGDKERCLEAGMDDFLPKPATLNGVNRLLKQWLSTPSTEIAVGM